MYVCMYIQPHKSIYIKLIQNLSCVNVNTNNHCLQSIHIYHNYDKYKPLSSRETLKNLYHLHNKYPTQITMIQSLQNWLHNCGYKKILLSIPYTDHYSIHHQQLHVLQVTCSNNGQIIHI